jgi:hypothetical protein
MAANATLALNGGLRVRRARLAMLLSPDPRHYRRAQAEIPLIDLSGFAWPALNQNTVELRR